VCVKKKWKNNLRGREGENIQLKLKNEQVISHSSLKKESL
jgi:hypothetical protein